MKTIKCIIKKSSTGIYGWLLSAALGMLTSDGTIIELANEELVNTIRECTKNDLVGDTAHMNDEL